jgi:hypothetical protein
VSRSPAGFRIGSDPQGTIFSILGSDTDRIRIKVNIQELNRLTMEPWRAVDANKGGVEAQNEASLVTEEQDPNPHFSDR